MKIPEAYERISEQRLSDISSDGILLRHKKSGARIAVVKNSDENKVFYIAFRTPVSDSTGVAHIIEHTVLCGSEKYPVKDPFIELAKGSLNTFLNAMTYPDKTVYPVASCNETDFKNLTDVYLDAVFHPNIYHYEEIFRQEGWHYEMEKPEDPLTINGVVYSEMKGALSSPEDVFSREVVSSLYPDTTYRYESGGDPEEIPTLTYEQYLDFHRRYYHPSNSYIYLYGDCDMEERLAYLDREYLSAFDAIDPDSEIGLQEPFAQTNRIRSEYSIRSDEPAEDNTYLSVNYSIGDSSDQMLLCAMSILDEVLLTAPSAPLRRAFAEAEIGTSVIGGLDSSIRMPYFTIGVKGANESDREQFLSICSRVLKEQADGGLDRKAVYAAIRSNQFSFREADFGHFPKGLIRGLDMLETWLYDDSAPFDVLRYLSVTDQLKEKIEEGYFEELIRKYFIENPHRSEVILAPKAGLTAERDERLLKKLSEKKASLSREELARIISDTAALVAYQTTPSPQEDLEKIPLLKRSDLRRNIRPIFNEILDADGTPYYFHNIGTNGIHYLTLGFDITDLPEENDSTIALMCSLLGMMDTKEHTFSELDTLLNLHTGGFGVQATILPLKERDTWKLFVKADIKFVYDQEQEAEDLLSEILLETDFTDREHLKELILNLYSRKKTSLISAGHSTAMRRVQSYCYPVAAIRERLTGIDCFYYLKDLAENFSERADQLIASLQRLSKEIFSKSRLFADSTADRSQAESVKKFLGTFTEKLPEGSRIDAYPKITLPSPNEAFSTASRVQYVARGGSMHPEFHSTGAYQLLSPILGYEYFWQNVRVRGGAYGCMSRISRQGYLAFASYRDPNLAETSEIFDKTGDYLRSFSVSERDMTKYIIGACANADVPMTPSDEGERDLSILLSGYSEEDLQKMRDEMLDCTQEDIRKLADSIDCAMQEGYICVIGSEDKIEENRKMFQSVHRLG